MDRLRSVDKVLPLRQWGSWGWILKQTDSKFSAEHSGDCSIDDLHVRLAQLHQVRNCLEAAAGTSGLNFPYCNYLILLRSTTHLNVISGRKGHKRH